jgi:hypothetical protein
MKKILIVSYMYPPIFAMGTVRVQSFVKHLPKLGWEPYVLTVMPSDWVLSNREIPAGESTRTVCRTNCLDMSRLVGKLFGRWARGGGITRSKAQRETGPSLLKLGISLYDTLLAFPDSTWPWYFLGRKEALEFGLKVRPDVILSSSAPFMSHMMAARLRERLGVPWVADFRDLWSQNAFVDYPAPARWARERVEARVLRSAAALCTVSEPFAEELREKHGKETFVVMNGYEPSPAGPAPAPLEGFTILYTGMLYPGKLDPALLFQALRSMKDGGRLPAGLRVAFYGPNHDVTLDQARAAGVAELVRCHEPVPQAEALELQRRAQLLLVMDFHTPRGKGVYPGKLFEYLGAGRPILAVGKKDGVMDRLLRSVGAGRTASTAAEVEELLLEAHARHAAGLAAPARDEAAVAALTRERQAAILAAKLDALTSGR